MPTAVKARAGGFSAPPHVAIALNARSKRSRKPRKTIDYLTYEYRLRRSRIHVVDGHDDFLSGIVVYPHVHRIVAESSSGPQQHKREAENLDRLPNNTTHSWNSQK